MIPAEVTALPLYPHLDEIAGTLATRNLLMLHAEPGAGKTTLVGGKMIINTTIVGKSRVIILMLQSLFSYTRPLHERLS